MWKYKNFIVSLITVLLFASCATAQWTQTGNVGGTGVYSFINHGGKWFIKTSGGVYQSSDNGGHWSDANNGIRSTISSFWSIGDTLLALAFNGNVYATLDDGTNWNVVDSIPGGIRANSLFETGGYVFVGTDHGVFKSLDNGLHWQASSTGMIDSLVTGFAYVGNALFAGTDSSVWKSTDLGGHWIKSGVGLPDASVTALTSLGTTLFAGLYPSDGMYRSTNLGDTWTEVKGGLPNFLNFGCFAFINGYLYAGCPVYDIGMYRSGDSGKTWVEFDSGLVDRHVYFIVAVDGDVFCGTEDGFHHLDTNSSTWSVHNQGLMGDILRVLGSDGEIIYGGGGENLYRSTDNGMQWERLSFSMFQQQIQSIFLGNGIMLVASDGGIHRSVDKGVTLTPSGSGLTVQNANQFAMLGNNIFVGTSAGVHVSSDNGLTWTKTITEPPDTTIISLSVDGAALIVSTDGLHSLYRSEDGGSSWQVADSGLPKYSWAGSIVPEGGNLFALVSGSLWRSTDHGRFWNRPVNNLPRYIGRNSLVSYGNTLFVGEDNTHPFFQTTGGGVYKSTDQGLTWVDVSTGLDDTLVNALKINNGNLIAATEEGRVWRRPLSEVVGVKRAMSEIPTNVLLGNNFPNPFSYSTSIDFIIPTSDRVTLTVFNSLGQEIETLVDKQQSSGHHIATFNADHLQNGVYWFRLTAGKNVITQKMIVVR